MNSLNSEILISGSVSEIEFLDPNPKGFRKGELDKVV